MEHGYGYFVAGTVCFSLIPMKYLERCSRLAALILLSVCLYSTTQAQVQSPRYVNVNLNCKGFYEYLPSGYANSPGQKFPLIVFVHGLGELGDGSAAKLPLVLRNGPPKLINNKTWPDSFNVNGQWHKPIVISPQFIKWPTPGDMDTLVNYVVANYKIDRSRIYVTGLSMGGGVTWNYASNSTAWCRRIAAIVPVCGATTPSTARGTLMGKQDLPVWATHNQSDPTVAVSNTNNYISYINESATPPDPLARKTIFPVSGHDAWSTTYNPNYREDGKNVYEWMLQFRREFTSTWIGGTSTAWDNNANWSEGIVPDANTNVVINNGNIIIKKNVEVKSINIARGASLKVDPGFKLNIVQ